MNPQKQECHSEIRASFKLLRGASAKPSSKQQDLAFSLDIDSTMPASGVTAIFGHSGSGKTTLLRCIAGLESQCQGLFSIKDEIWQNDSVFVPPHQRSVGYVFQDAGLFPHLTAQGNIDFALKRCNRNIPSDEYEKILNILGISSLFSQYPEQLSGGEKQRVAIARALVVQPDILLMDEPLASLDNARRQEILPYLEQLKDELEIPIIYVSHSIDEVTRLADHVLVMEQGKLVSQGPVTEIFSNIDSPFLYANEKGVILSGRVSERDSQWHLAKIDLPGGELWARDGGDEIGKDVRVRVLAKDVSISLSPDAHSSIQNRIPARVAQIIDDHDDAMSLIQLDIGSEHLIARLTKRASHNLGLEKGLSVWAQVKSVAIVR